MFDWILLKYMANLSSGQFFQADPSPGSSSGEVRLSNVTASSSQERRMAAKQFSEGTLVRCSNYQEGRPVCSSESFGGNRSGLYWTGILVWDLSVFMFLSKLYVSCFCIGMLVVRCLNPLPANHLSLIAVLLL